MSWAKLLVTLLGSLLLWVAGTIVFDAVHWLLHLLLRSRSRALRIVAWPHGVHHRFLDARLSIQSECQGKNTWCHLVPEYLTQLAWSAVMLAWLPRGMVLGCGLGQTLAFALLVSYRGRDPNHLRVGAPVGVGVHMVQGVIRGRAQDRWPVGIQDLDRSMTGPWEVGH